MNAPAQWDSAVVVGTRGTTWRELAGRFDDVIGPDRRVAVVARDTLTPWAAFAAAVRNDGDLVLVDGDRADPALLQTLREAGCLVVDGADRHPPLHPTSTRPGRTTVLTSGTTGTPKLVEHRLDTLVSRSAGPGEPPRRWLCPYAPGTYAWYQMATTALFTPGQSVVPVVPRDVGGWVEQARDAGVSAVSATPSFWRSTLMGRQDGELRLLDLVQITLGGEVVEQSLLDQLRQLYPAARLTHVYATSETGAVLAVHDGRAGFPAEWLTTRRASGVRLRLQDGLLEVRSPWAHAGAGDDWTATGDHALVRDGRVHVLGRSSSRFINVGGAKVDATAVRDALLSHPAVAWARVRARRAPVVGQVPVADVVLHRGHETGVADLLAHAARELPDVAVPRLVTLHDEIPLTPALKAAL